MNRERNMNDSLDLFWKYRQVSLSLQNRRGDLKAQKMQSVKENSGKLCYTEELGFTGRHHKVKNQAIS